MQYNAAQISNTKNIMILLAKAIAIMLSPCIDYLIVQIMIACLHVYSVIRYQTSDYIFGLYSHFLYLIVMITLFYRSSFHYLIFLSFFFKYY